MQTQRQVQKTLQVKNKGCLHGPPELLLFLISMNLEQLIHLFMHSTNSNECSDASSVV